MHHVVKLVLPNVPSGSSCDGHRDDGLLILSISLHEFFRMHQTCSGVFVPLSAVQRILYMWQHWGSRGRTAGASVGVCGRMSCPRVTFLTSTHYMIPHKYWNNRHQPLSFHRTFLHVLYKPVRKQWVFLYRQKPKKVLKNIYIYIYCLTSIYKMMPFLFIIIIYFRTIDSVFGWVPCPVICWAAKCLVDCWCRDMGCVHVPLTDILCDVTRLDCVKLCMI